MKAPPFMAGTLALVAFLASGFLAPFLLAGGPFVEPFVFGLPGEALRFNATFFLAVNVCLSFFRLLATAVVAFILGKCDLVGTAVAVLLCPFGFGSRDFVGPLGFDLIKSGLHNLFDAGQKSISSTKFSIRTLFGWL